MTVLFPFVPVTATTGTVAASNPRSMSPRTATPAAAAATNAGWRGPHARARHHEIDAGEQRGPVTGRGPLDDRRAERLHRAHALVVPAVARVLLDHRHRVAAPRARPGDRFAGGPQPDDEDAPAHSMTPGMLMKS